MLSLFREDIKKQVEGSPCYTDSSDEPMTFYVARVGTKLFREQIKDITEAEYGLFPKPSDIDEEKITAHWLAYYGVLGWDNLVDGETDEPQPFSRSFAIKLFLNEQYWLSLNKVLINHASNFEHYLIEEEQNDIDGLKKK